MLQPLYFAKQAEQRKQRKYQAASRAINKIFKPMAFETFGAVGPLLNETLKRLAPRIARFNDWHQSSEITYISSLIRFWRTRISTCLQRCNAKLVLSKAHRIRANSRLGSHPRPSDISSSWFIRWFVLEYCNLFKAIYLLFMIEIFLQWEVIIFSLWKQW